MRDARLLRLLREIKAVGRLTLLPAAIGLSPGRAASAPLGQEKASTCVACHGLEGRSANDEWPNLAGQKASYMVRQLKDFRDGRRYSPLMTPVAKMLTDGDIGDLSAYFSAMKTGDK